MGVVYALGLAQPIQFPMQGKMRVVDKKRGIDVQP